MPEPGDEHFDPIEPAKPAAASPSARSRNRALGAGLALALAIALLLFLFANRSTLRTPQHASDSTQANPASLAEIRAITEEARKASLDGDDEKAISLTAESARRLEAAAANSLVLSSLSNRCNVARRDSLRLTASRT